MSYVPLKRRSTIILHGSTSQKTNLNFILAAVRTWNIKYLQNIGLKRCQIISLPGAPTCPGRVLITDYMWCFLICVLAVIQIDAWTWLSCCHTINNACKFPGVYIKTRFWTSCMMRAFFFKLVGRNRYTETLLIGSFNINLKQVSDLIITCTK
jgi:hypothetical protein